MPVFLIGMITDDSQTNTGSQVFCEGQQLHKQDHTTSLIELLSNCLETQCWYCVMTTAAWRTVISASEEPCDMRKSVDDSVQDEQRATDSLSLCPPPPPLCWCLTIYWSSPSLCVCVCVSVCLCVFTLTPSAFSSVLASISCRARTDSDCSRTKVQMDRSGGTFWDNRTQHTFHYLSLT